MKSLYDVLIEAAALTPMVISQGKEDKAFDGVCSFVGRNVLPTYHSYLENKTGDDLYAVIKETIDLDFDVLSDVMLDDHTQIDTLYASLRLMALNCTMILQRLDNIENNTKMSLEDIFSIYSDIHKGKEVHYGNFCVHHGKLGKQFASMTILTNIKQKVIRLNSFISKRLDGSNLSDIALYDSLSDIAVYAIMGIQLMAVVLDTKPKGEIV